MRSLFEDVKQNQYGDVCYAQVLQINPEQSSLEGKYMRLRKECKR